MLQKKLERLKKILKDMRSVLLAFSGGLDSTFLLRVAVDTLADKVLAVTADSPTLPRRELKSAKDTALKFGARYLVIKTRELDDKRFIRNSPRRCYFCKRELFSKLNRIAARKKISFVIDASNLCDRKDFRPGSMAKQEFGIRSPLQEACLSKKEIRILSKKLRLSVWDKPPTACLASRIPYGVEITATLLKRVEKAEEYLNRLGFSCLRLRHYNGLARIEVAKEQMPFVLNRRRDIVRAMKKMGYNYVTLDLEGYRPGSMNIAQRRKITVKTARCFAISR
jgi:uncharacterized protein